MSASQRSKLISQGNANRRRHRHRRYRENTEVLRAWLGEHRPVILYGPQVRQTMSLTSVLKSMPDFILASLNFSSATSLNSSSRRLSCANTSLHGMGWCLRRRAWKMARGLLRRNQSARQRRVRHAEGEHVYSPDRREPRILEGVRPSMDIGRTHSIRGRLHPPTDPGRVPLSLRVFGTPLLMVDYPATPSLYQYMAPLIALC